MTQNLNRRSFLSASAVAGLSATALGSSPTRPTGVHRPLVIASGNGLRTVEKAMELIRAGADPLDAAIEGVAIVEADPKDHSVGYGGLPNENGVVELDAAVMHGPTHGGGGVAALAQHHASGRCGPARHEADRTTACSSARERSTSPARMGFPRSTCLPTRPAGSGSTGRRPAVRTATGSLPRVGARPGGPSAIFGIRLHGTIHCSALDTHGNLGCVTTTSGLSYKIPGRVGDSPILGAGLYLDNEVGSAGSTGRGEANLLNLSSHLIVEEYAGGSPPRTR